ncbi:hypothetical protein ARMGADRAFT_1028389 [Armillaria gallica]|uniref:Uncharacterized protein n=1 Tax=Armillaria gallica TaxID=47427 RepID=A0A2H3DZB2_ARMGA|nr:hypothetical protein ARMGADRAFT_1028389 [Armillaria gallica]
MDVPPPDLSQDAKNVIFEQLDLNLNTMILESWLHGLYTGIVIITLWVIFTSKKRLHGTFLCTIIIMLYILLTTSFTMNWVFESHASIEYGNNYYSVFKELTDNVEANYFIDGITGGIGTILVDITIIWHCWVLWDYQWQVVFIPMMCAVVATALPDNMQQKLTGH